MSSLFEGIKVLDFTNNAAGPSAAALFADFGAEVIKIERPAVGDDTRSFAPRVKGQSTSTPWHNRGKKSVEISLVDPEGVKIIEKIIPDMDIIIESFRPGIMKKFGLDYESVIKINPNIIYCSVSAFGQTGPYSTQPGYDLIAQGLSGLMDMTGEGNAAPQKHGSILGDYVGGLNAFGAISAALYYKGKTGKGQHVDISLLDGLVYLNGVVDQTNAGLYQTRQGNHSTALCPYGVFRGKGSQSIIVCAPNNKLWATLCGIMNQESFITDETFATPSARIKNLPKVIALIEGWASTFEDIDDALVILDKAGIPSCKVMDIRDVMAFPQIISREMIIDMPAPDSLVEAGVPTLKARGAHIKLDKTPAVIRKSPDLGQHNHEIVERYGIDGDDFDVLLERWISQVK